MAHPSYLGWQIDWPVFVKMPFHADGKDWKKGEYFNWFERSLNPGSKIEPSAVAALYNTGFVHHNKELEKQTKVGDRLEEFEGENLKTLVRRLNDIVKARTNSASEFNNKRCKQSTLEDKQKGLLRSFLRNNRWIEEDFYKIRDDILGAE